MLRGTEPPNPTTCMMCNRSPARYHGAWAAGGLCRPCLERMAPDLRVLLLRDMDPADRKRFQLDQLFERGAAAPTPTSRRLEDAIVATPVRPLSPSTDARVARQSASDRPERRRHPRVRVRLPAGLMVTSPPAGPSPTRPRAYHTVCRDLSLGGVRVAAEPKLLDLPSGSPVRIEVLLPQPSLPLHCRGTVRNATPGRQGADLGALGLAFSDLAPADEFRLQSYIAAVEASAAA